MSGEIFQQTIKLLSLLLVANKSSILFI
uniref:Uncharacterized protein n=1 Tax=Anopheles atroparvus TaxID=41427 RepID=A0AAG5DM16_ANOAO